MGVSLNRALRLWRDLGPGLMVGCNTKEMQARVKEARSAMKKRNQPRSQRAHGSRDRNVDGTIKAELWPDKAPQTVANFLKYADGKFYDGLSSTGDPRLHDPGRRFTPDMQQKPTSAPVKKRGALGRPERPRHARHGPDGGD